MSSLKFPKVKIMIQKSSQNPLKSGPKLLSTSKTSSRHKMLILTKKIEDFLTYDDDPAPYEELLKRQIPEELKN